MIGLVISNEKSVLVIVSVKNKINQMTVRQMPGVLLTIGLWMTLNNINEVILA